MSRSTNAEQRLAGVDPNYAVPDIALQQTPGWKAAQGVPEGKIPASYWLERGFGDVEPGTTRTVARYRGNGAVRYMSVWTGVQRPTHEGEASGVYDLVEHRVVGAGAARHNCAEGCRHFEVNGDKYSNGDSSVRSLTEQTDQVAGELALAARLLAGEPLQEAHTAVLYGAHAGAILQTLVERGHDPRFGLEQS